MGDPLALPLTDLRRRRSAKWSMYGPDVLPLFVAEMDCTLAPAVAEVLQRAVTDGDTGYAAPAGPVAEAFAGFAQRRWGWSPDPADVVAVTDVAVGATALVRMLTAPGEPVIVNPPVYPPFFEWVRGSGMELVEVPLAAGRLDLDALESAYAAGARVHLLCNPHNPVGTVHTPAELAQVAGLAARYGVQVIVDEIHAALTLPGAAFTPFLSVPGGAEVGVSLHAASKAWNLPGLKCAVSVTASAGMRRRVAALRTDAHWHLGHFGALATEAAFAQGDGWLDDLLVALAARRELLGRLLAGRLPDIAWQPPSATYLAWLDCRGLELPGDPATIFLDRGRVALESGPRFGSAGAGFVRLNFATNPDVLTAAVDRMAAVQRT